MFNIAKAICLLLCLSVITVHAETTLTRGDPRIIGGEIADFGDWPSTAALFVTKKGHEEGTYSCGGALIAPQWVLTAAHCVKGEQATNMFVRLGTTDLSDNQAGERIKVKKIISYPQYNEATFDNDLALIELKNVSKIKTIPLFIGDIEEGTPAAVVGWGTRNVNPFTGEGFNPSLQLYELQLPIVGQAQCKLIMEDIRNMGPVTNNMICAGTGLGGEDTCQGDSGGPLMAMQNDEIRLVGVISWGFGCAKPNTYGVYTRLNKFSKWIKSSMEAKPSNDSEDSEGGAIFWMLFPFFALLLAYKARRID